MLNEPFLEGVRSACEVRLRFLVPYTMLVRKSYLYEDRYKSFVFPLTSLLNHALNDCSCCSHPQAMPHHRQAPQTHVPLHRVIA